MKGLFACLLLTAVAQAVQVYLSPTSSLPPRLSPKDAGFVLSHHLGLEFFETAGSEIFDGNHEQTFVAQGSSNALLLTINEAHIQDVIPSSLKPSFALNSKISASSLSSIISTYLHRAPYAYSHIFSVASIPSYGVPRLLDIFSAPSPATEAFLAELSTLLAFLESDSSSSEKFGALELTGLDKMVQTYGRYSEQYKIASEALRAFMQSAFTNNNIHVALLTFSNSIVIREPQQSSLPTLQMPIVSDSVCHSTAEICANSTRACSGRGECVHTTKAGRTCFVCACSATIDAKGRTDHWAGEACERKDVSGPFVLLAGTVIGLLIVIVGSVSLLYGVGEAELPSTLTGGPGVGGPKKD